MFKVIIHGREMSNTPKVGCKSVDSFYYQIYFELPFAPFNGLRFWKNSTSADDDAWEFTVEDVRWDIEGCVFDCDIKGNPANTLEDLELDAAWLERHGATITWNRATPGLN
jgi:hypothetical protein